MSEMTPEAPRRPARRENAFTRKIGPLPMWAWLGIVATVIVIWGVWQARKNSQAAQQTTSASDVPDFINQVYESPEPPGPAQAPSGPGMPVRAGGGSGAPPQRPPPAAVPPGFPAPRAGGKLPGPVRRTAAVRESPEAPHPATRAAPRHTAPRHPARG